MRAIVQDRYGSSDELRLAEVGVPTIEPNEVLVRVHASSIDRGVWHLMTGQPYLARLAFGFRRPKDRIPGMNLAGVVLAAGSAVQRFKVGGEVFGVGRGAFAEFATAPEDQIALKPANLTFEQAAAIPVSAVTALKAARDVANIQAGQKVLIIGASGGVGTFAVQIAKALGAEVTGVCSTSKTELVRSIGADHVLDYTREDVTAGPERYDVIVDIAGNRSLSHLRRVLTPAGTLVIIGGEGGGKWLGGLERQLLAAALSMFVRQNLRSVVSIVNARDLDALTGLIESGELTPVIDRTYPLAQTPEALRYLEAGSVMGKLVISVAQSAL